MTTPALDSLGQMQQVRITIAILIALALLVVAGAAVRAGRRRRWTRLLRVDASLAEPATYVVGPLMPAGPNLAVLVLLGDSSVVASSPLPFTLQGKLDG